MENYIWRSNQWLLPLPAIASLLSTCIDKGLSLLRVSATEKGDEVYKTVYLTFFVYFISDGGAVICMHIFRQIDIFRPSCANVEKEILKPQNNPRRVPFSQRVTYWLLVNICSKYWLSISLFLNNQFQYWPWNKRTSWLTHIIKPQMDASAPSLHTCH